MYSINLSEIQDFKYNELAVMFKTIWNEQEDLIIIDIRKQTHLIKSRKNTTYSGFLSSITYKCSEELSEIITRMGVFSYPLFRKTYVDTNIYSSWRTLLETTTKIRDNIKEV